jgi:hypothetical protein
MTSIDHRHPPRRQHGKRDRRYSVAREYCGCSTPQWVVRFCGDWIGRAGKRPDALAIAHTHQRAHLRRLGLLRPSPE